MHQTRMEYAYTELRERVWTGELPPGTRLVNRTLGNELGVSTVTVREAIQRLASEGLVKYVPNAGAYVRQMDRKEMIDLIQFRANLDCFVVEQAAVKIANHHLSLLANICDEWRILVHAMRTLPDRLLTSDSLKRWLEIDARFHGVLVQAADNSWITSVVNGIDLNARAMRTKAAYLTFDEAAATYRQHGSILRALRKHDTQRALYWMKVHGESSLRYLLNHIDDVSREIC